jgi:hypothetical protein
VRTASIVADQGAPPDVAAASLLHSAYSHGDFGTGGRALSEAVETLVAHYAALSWHPQAQDRCVPAPEEVAGMDATQRTVLLMRLCNELEEPLDLADLHSSDFREQLTASPQALERLQRVCSRCGELAHALERPALAGSFAALWEEIAAARVPEACVVEPRLRVSALLHRPRGVAASYRLPPRVAAPPLRRVAP